MQVKKFEATTIAEALQLVKNELGPEAIILSTKNHKKGFGLLSKPSVEITAAVSEKSLSKKKVAERLIPNESKERMNKLTATKQSEIYNDFSNYVDKRKDENTKKKNNYKEANSAKKYVDIMDEEREERNVERNHETDSKLTAPATNYAQPAYGRNAKIILPPEQLATPMVGAASGGLNQINHNQVEVMKKDIESLKSIIEDLKLEHSLVTNQASMNDQYSERLQEEFQNLIRNGIEKKFANQIIKNVIATVPRADLKTSEQIIEAIAIDMMGNTKVAHPLEQTSKGQKILALVGPTGVGKTTTIAKLASHAILQKNLKVGLINIDSYKVAAVDQLATYAKILNTPFRQATNSLELDRAIAEFKLLDLILIDTSGRSQKDSDSLTQMKNLLKEIPSAQTHLIMSATTRDQELYDVVSRFKLFNPAGLIFSKLDETNVFGCIYNVMKKTNLPLNYFTVGQRVPEDIEEASQERLASLILDI